MGSLLKNVRYAALSCRRDNDGYDGGTLDVSTISAPVSYLVQLHR